jgi:hypothetical protein
MTGYLRSSIACRALIAPAAAGAVWLAVLGHPWLAGFTGWLTFLAVLLGGLLHLGHHRTLTHNRQKETTTR